MKRKIAILFLLLTGCAIGPDFERPEAPKAGSYTKETLPDVTETADTEGGAAQHFVPGQDIPGQWWQLFHSKALNALIEEALKNNPDLDAAQAALRVARESTLAGEGAYYPSISGDFSPSRQKQSNITTSNVSNNAYIYNLFSAGVSVSYSPDIFGGTRRQVEALEAQENLQRFQLEATYLTLTSNLAIAALQEASLKAQLEATNDILRVNDDLLAILRHQRELGEVSGSDVAAQEALQAQAEQNLPNLQKQLAQQRDLIAALAGHFPGDGDASEFTLADLKLPTEIPVTLPSKLVEHRPDIRAAEEQLHAASANIGIAEAARLPQLSLSGDMGSLAGQIGRMFTPGNGFWTLAADVSQPIFDGGTLLHHERGADAAYDEAAAQYRSTIISAFQNVADTLHALNADAKTLKSAAHYEHAAAKSLSIAKTELKLGEIGPLELLNAEQAWQQARINLVEAETSRYVDTVALFQALGGGWWNRSDIIDGGTKSKVE